MELNDGHLQGPLRNVWTDYGNEISWCAHVTNQTLNGAIPRVSATRPRLGSRRISKDPLRRGST